MQLHRNMAYDWLGHFYTVALGELQQPARAGNHGMVQSCAC